MGRNLIYILIIINFIIIIKEDIKKREIPNSCNILLFILGLNLNGESGILGASVYLAPFFLIYGYLSDLLKKDTLGFGDLKLIFSLGAILNYRNYLEVIKFMNLTFILATVYILIEFILKRRLRRELPLSPFLILSFAILYGRNLWKIEDLHI